MDIHSKKGTKVMFTGKGGYDNDNNYANDFLVIGNTYTVDFTKVGNFNTIVILEEIPGKIFNSVTGENKYEFKNKNTIEKVLKIYKTVKYSYLALKEIGEKA